MTETRLHLPQYAAWELSYEYKMPAFNGIPASYSHGKIIYSSPSAQEAVAAAQRFMNGRVKAAPEFFERFVHFQIHPYVIGPIDEHGGIFNSRQFRTMEWSRDRAGVDLDTYCAWKIEEFKRLEAKSGKG